MGAVGETLRRERLKSGVELDRISQETKIPTRYLEAIEQEEFEKLPGRVFLISFVRSYAQALGLDEAELIAELRAAEAPLPPPPVLESPPPRRSQWTGIPEMLAGKILGGTDSIRAALQRIGIREVLAGTLFRGTDLIRAVLRRTGMRVKLAGAAVVVVAFMVAYTAPWSGSAPPDPADTPETASPATSGSADRLVPPERQAELPPAPQTAGEAQPTLVREADPPPAPVAAAGLRLVLVAKQRTWVSAKQDGHRVFAGPLQPNESRVLEGRGAVDVVIGNPEGVEVSLNGKLLEIPGSRGEQAEVRIAAPDAPPVISHRHSLADIY